MKGRSDGTVSRAKTAKDAKVKFDKKKWHGRGLCELSVLGARKFLEVILSNILNGRIYLMTLSARTSTFGGIVRPICFAAVRLIMNSNFIGCSTGRSAGFLPFRILST